MTPVGQVGDVVRIIENELGAPVGAEVVVLAVEDDVIVYTYADDQDGYDVSLIASHYAYEIVTVAA